MLCASRPPPIEQVRADVEHDDDRQPQEREPEQVRVCLLHRNTGRAVDAGQTHAGGGGHGGHLNW